MKSSEYIDGKYQNGKLYDWKKISKEVNLLYSDDYYKPLKAHTIKDDTKFYFDLSSRGYGKTINWLLVGLVMYKMYGTITCYIRETSEMIMPKNTMDLFGCIIDCGYIEKIYDGKYNSLKYSSRRWYLYNTETEEIDDSECVMMLAINEVYNTKSGLSIPNGDLLIFDECISTRYAGETFVMFCDLVSTIIRKRFSPIIVLLANTIDKNAKIFYEMEIQKNIIKMPNNQVQTFTCGSGVKVEVLILDTPPNEIPVSKQKHNRMFFGFNNSKLSAITGVGWSEYNYPHIPKKTESLKILCTNRYLEINGQYIHVELRFNRELGYFVACHLANKVYDDSIIYTHYPPTKANEFFYSGVNKVDGMIHKLRDMKRWYYSDNSVGSLVDTWFKECSI